MDKENIEDWFDRVMGEEPEPKPTDEVVLTEEDFHLLFGSAPTPPGIVYYDSSGAIRGVSHGLNPELADRFEHVEVSSEQANDFISGKVDLSGWLVVYQGDQARLICSTVDALTVMPTGQGYCTVEETNPAPIQIILMIPRDSVEAALLLRTINGIAVEPGFTEKFDFIITKKGSPDQVLSLVSVDPEEFFGKGEIEINLGRIIGDDVDVLTKPLWPVQYVVDRFDEGARPLPLPRGRFEEFVPYRAVSHTDGLKPGLLAEVYDDRVHLSLLDGGGRVFDRPLTTLLVAASRAHDREAMLWSTRVLIRDLNRGLDVPLMEPLTGPIEIVSARYFVNTYWRDNRSTKF